MTTNDAKTLQRRLQTFALDFLKLVKVLPKTEENKIYGHQGIRSSSSIGANYAEAIYAFTKQDFVHTINICRKETNESIYWLEMLLMVNPQCNDKITNLFDEGNQILKIFISSIKTARRNSKDDRS